MKKVYALIGGIASGKSEATAILNDLGAYIIDADVISHELTSEGGKGERALLKRFPSCAQGEKLDRGKLKRLVFSDQKELKALNDITHPLILAEIDRRIKETDGIVVVVMPLPSGLRRYDGVLNVYTPMETRIERLIKRDNIDRQLAQRIIAAQMSDEQFQKAADFTFLNDGDREKLRGSIEKWWEIYIEG